MIVNHLFCCETHGDFIMMFNTVDFPTRDFPLKNIECPECGVIAYWRGGANMSPDQYWSGVAIPEVGLTNVTSKKFLRRYLKEQKITQMTKEDLTIGGGVPMTTAAERFEKFTQTTEYKRELQETISKSLDGYGVIDKAV